MYNITIARDFSLKGSLLSASFSYDVYHCDTTVVISYKRSLCNYTNCPYTLFMLLYVRTCNYGFCKTVSIFQRKCRHASQMHEYPA